MLYGSTGLRYGSGGCARMPGSDMVRRGEDGGTGAKTTRGKQEWNQIGDGVHDRRRMRKIVEQMSESTCLVCDLAGARATLGNLVEPNTSSSKETRGTVTRAVNPHRTGELGGSGGGSQQNDGITVSWRCTTIGQPRVSGPWSPQGAPRSGRGPPRTRCAPGRLCPGGTPLGGGGSGWDSGRGTPR